MSARRLVIGALFAFSVASSSLPARAAALSLVQVVQDSASGLSGASAVAVSPDGKNAYVTSESGNSVSMFYRDLGANAFFYMGKLVDGVDADGLQGASAIAISPDGQSVYVTGKTANALAVFERFSSGLLSFTGVLREGFDGVDGLTAPTGVAVGPTGPGLRLELRRRRPLGLRP